MGVETLTLPSLLLDGALPLITLCIWNAVGMNGEVVQHMTKTRPIVFPRVVLIQLSLFAFLILCYNYILLAFPEGAAR